MYCTYMEIILIQHLRPAEANRTSAFESKYMSVQCHDTCDICATKCVHYTEYIASSKTHPDYIDAL